MCQVPHLPAPQMLQHVPVVRMNNYLPLFALTLLSSQRLLTNREQTLIKAVMSGCHILVLLLLFSTKMFPKVLVKLKLKFS